MSRAQRAGGLAYLQAVSVTMHFFGSVGQTLLEDEALGVLELCERLAEAEPASRAGWLLLARVLRHLLGALDEAGDPRAALLHELHRDVMAHADHAAPARQNGE
jgi:hypothetical protein